MSAPRSAPADGTAAPAIADGTASRLAEQFKSLADPVRLRLLDRIAAASGDGIRAGDLAAAFDLAGPTVSHHLRILAETGLVDRRPCGTSVYYRPSPATVRLMGPLKGLLGTVAAAGAPDTLRGILDTLAEGHGTDTGNESAGADRGPEEGDDPAVRPLPGLLDTHDILARVQERLTVRFSGIFSAQTVARYLADSYESLARSAAVTPHLPVLTEQFAAERLASVAQAEGLLAKPVPEVLFVCVRNAGRSQIAAGLLRQLAGERVHIRSAGSMPAAGIDSDVAAVMAEIGIDVATEYPKPLTDAVVTAADIVVTMGCGDACPVFPGKRYLDWDVPDPAGGTKVRTRRIRDDVERRIREQLLDSLLR